MGYETRRDGESPPEWPDELIYVVTIRVPFTIFILLIHEPYCTSTHHPSLQNHFTSLARLSTPPNKSTSASPVAQSFLSRKQTATTKQPPAQPTASSLTARDSLSRSLILSCTESDLPNQASALQSFDACPVFETGLSVDSDFEK